MPGPPPGAGEALATISVFAAAPVAAAGVGEVLGLNKSARVLCGEADACGTGVVDAAVVIAAFFRVVFAAPSVTGGAFGAPVGIEATLGDGDGSAFAAFLRAFLAGDAEASAAGEVAAAGEVSAAASFFLRDFFSGEADGSAPADALASGEAAGLASAFLCDLRLAGDSAGEGVGDWACTTEAAAKPNATSRMKYLVLMH